MEHLGGEKFVLATDTRNIAPDSVVYSFGVGTDVSWDINLIEKYGCTVHAFDPTPRSIAWVESQKLPVQFNFHPYGLGRRDGVMKFYDPPNPKNVSYSSARKNGVPSEFPVKRLATIMRELGHDHIDILKIDIEGSEFEVLPDIRHLPIQQIIVEFHSRFFKFGKLREWVARLQLKSAGFRLFYQNMNDWSFVRR